jgi:tetratricopeptide (TPR) repeat protein
MNLRPALLFLGLVGLVPNVLAGVTINANVKEGDTISGDFTFRLTVESESLVSSCEFYVGNDLRETDDSTPYEFTIDTLAEQQGSISVTFAAYNKAGESSKKTFKLVIDNGFGMPIASHIERGNDALSHSKWDEAIAAGRVALKIDATSNAARILMARANLGKGVLDLAQKYAEDAYAAAPGDSAVQSLLSSVMLKKAFNTYSKGGDKSESIAIVKASLVKAAETRRAALQGAVDNFGPVDDSNRIKYCDVLLQAGRYSAIASELDPLFQKDMKNNSVANRYLYALLRGGKFTRAAQVLDSIKKYGAHDGYGFGLRSCYSAYFGDIRAALDAEKDAILDDPTSLGVRTAQAYLALRRADTKTANNILGNLMNAEGHNPVVNYDVCALAFLVGDYSSAQERFQTTMLAEPASYDALIERGNQSMYYSLRTDMQDDADYGKRQRALATAFFEAALAAKPESFEALTGMACAALLDGKKDEAVKFGRAAVAAGPEYAAAQWAYCAALFESGRSDDAKAAAKAAAKLDPKGLDGLSYPTPQSAWQYFYSKGRMPWLMDPGQ